MRLTPEQEMSMNIKDKLTECSQFTNVWKSQNKEGKQIKSRQKLYNLATKFTLFYFY